PSKWSSPSSSFASAKQRSTGQRDRATRSSSSVRVAGVALLRKNFSLPGFRTLRATSRISGSPGRPASSLGIRATGFASPTTGPPAPPLAAEAPPPRVAPGGRPRGGTGAAPARPAAGAQPRDLAALPPAPLAVSPPGDTGGRQPAGGVARDLGDVAQRPLGQA